MSNFALRFPGGESMAQLQARRTFLTIAAGLAGSLLDSPGSTARASRKKELNVLVWDERQPAQAEAYENFLGNAIADNLRTQPDLAVKSVGLDDPGQGLGSEVLSGTQVLVWWGHVRQAEVRQEVGRAIVERIKQGKLALLALHSAHWATPFMEAMNERARIDLKARPAYSSAIEVAEVPPPTRNTVPKVDSRLTPYTDDRKFPDGKLKSTLHLPFCCFPSYRNDGKPSTIKVLKPTHPIVEGIPSQFEIAREEMYCEPFHIPEPDEVVLEERWSTGEWFRSGMVWKLGKGQVFYFRPGHETYPTYKQVEPLKIVSNAVRWLGEGINRD